MTVLRSILAGLVFGAMAPLAMAGDVLLPAPSAHLDGLTLVTITVIEPSQSQSLKPVEVTYKGYPAATILDQLLGTASVDIAHGNPGDCLAAAFRGTFMNLRFSSHRERKEGGR